MKAIIVQFRQDQLIEALALPKDVTVTAAYILEPQGSVILTVYHPDFADEPADKLPVMKIEGFREMVQS